MSESGNRSSVDRERFRVAQQQRRKEHPVFDSDSKKSSPVLFGSPIKTTTDLSQRLLKNLGTYNDAVELLQHKDAMLQVYGTDRLPETPISSSGENHFEKGFRRALQAYPTREVEPRKPSPVAASGARVGPHRSPHKGAGSGQSAVSSQSSSLATNTLKAKHKSRASGQETHRKARLDPVSLHRKAHSPAPAAGEGPHGHSSEGKHSHFPPKTKRGSSHHSGRSALSNETEAPRRKKVKSSKHSTADHTSPPSSAPRAPPPSKSPRDPPPVSAPRDPPPVSAPRDPPPTSASRDPPPMSASRDPPPVSAPRDPPPVSASRDPSRKERVKKEKRHKERDAGRALAGTEPAPPISQKVESTSPINQKVESAPPNSRKVEIAPPTGPQVQSSSQMKVLVPKTGKTSARDQEGGKKKVKRIKHLTEPTAELEMPHTLLGTGTRPPPLSVKPFQEAKSVIPLVGTAPPEQPVGGGGGGGNKLRPGKLVLGEGPNSEKASQKSGHHQPSKLRCDRTIDDIIAEMTRGVVTPHSAIETPRKVNSTEFLFPTSADANTSTGPSLMRSHPVAPGPLGATHPRDTPPASLTHSIPVGGGGVSPLPLSGRGVSPRPMVGGGVSPLESREGASVINDLSLSESSSDSSSSSSDEEEGDDNGADNGVVEGKASVTPRTPILEKAMNMVKPLELITPIRPAPYTLQFPDPVVTAGSGSGNSQQVSEPCEPFNQTSTFEPLTHDIGKADTLGEDDADNDSSGDSASSGSDDSSDDDSNGADSDSESSDVDKEVEPDRPSVSDAPVDSKVAAPEVQLSSWDPAANASSAADTAGSLMGDSSAGAKSRTPSKCPRSSFNLLRSRLAQAPSSSAASSGGDSVRLSVTSSGVVTIPTTRVSRIPSTESTAFQPIAQPPAPEDRRRSSVSVSGTSPFHGAAMETGGNDSSESGEVSSSSSDEDEEEEQDPNTTLVEEKAGPEEKDSVARPLLVSVPRCKVHIPGPGPTAPAVTAIVHPKPQAEKQKAIVEPIVVTPVERVRRQSRGTSRDADDGGHLRYSHRGDYSSSTLVDYPSHSLQQRRHDRSHRSRSPRIHGDIGPQRRSHSEWRSGHHESRWERRRRGGYHTSSEPWPVTADDYLSKARRLKHYGDNLSGHLKGEVYLEAALMFMMSCYENEIANKECGPMYIDTVNLLEHILSRLNVSREEPLAVICLRCQAILYFRAFETKCKSEASIQTQKQLLEVFSTRAARAHNVSPYCNSSSPPAPSPASVSSNSSCHGTPSSVGEAGGGAVSVPGSTFAGAVRQVGLFDQLFRSNECWRQSNDIITHKRDNVHFFGTLDQSRGPISQYSPIHAAVEWAKEGLSWIREDRRPRIM